MPEPDLVAFTCRSWRFSTRLATGVWPLTCPPYHAGNINPEMLRAPLLYVRLHGVPDQPYLYGDNWLTALTIGQVERLQLPASLVFLEGCYGAGMAEAFLAGGARAVVGSDRATYGRRIRLGPAQQIGRAWLRAIRHGATAGTALAAALRTINNDYRAGWDIAGNSEAVV